MHSNIIQNMLNPFSAGLLKFDHHEIMTRSLEMTETMADRYSSDDTQREHSYEYQHERV